LLKVFWEDSNVVAPTLLLSSFVTSLLNHPQ
jgi:hypothetical protein